jgi:hypothetical protein
MEQQNKDFALALYNKLWENINSKDTRLWTFLSIYGAAVALAFGAGKLVDMELYAALIILILTLWALFIVLNADWWDHRNRLMVAGIEEKFPEATRGVIPSAYKGVRVVFMDRLNQVSVVLLVGVGLAIYMHTMWPFLRTGSITGWDVLLLLVLLYLGLGWGSWVWVAQIERRLREYYITAKELQNEVPPLDLALAKAAAEAAKQAAAKRAPRPEAARSVAQAARAAVPYAVRQGAAQPTAQQAAQTSADQVAAAARAAVPGVPHPALLQTVLREARTAVPVAIGVSQQAAQEVLDAAETAAGASSAARQVVAQAAQDALAQAVQQGQAVPTTQEAAQAAADRVAEAAERAAHDEEEGAAAAGAVAAAAEQTLSQQTDADLAGKELEARNVSHWRFRALFVLIVASVLFDASCFLNAPASILITGLGVVAQLFAAGLYIWLAVQYYRSGPNDLAKYPLRLFKQTPQGKRSWRPYWVPLIISLLFFLSACLAGFSVYWSKPGLPLRADQLSAADIKAEREALLEKWERLQKRSWDQEETQHKQELAGYLKVDEAGKLLSKQEARQDYVTKDDLDAAVKRAVKEATKKDP